MSGNAVLIKELAELKAAIKELERKRDEIRNNYQHLKLFAGSIGTSAAAALWEGRLKFGDSGAGSGVPNADQPIVTGISKGALFGSYGKSDGYPVAFDVPADEPAHDLQVLGEAWGLGYMYEQNGLYRPVCPQSTYVPPKQKPPPPPEPPPPFPPDPDPDPDPPPKTIPKHGGPGGMVGKPPTKTVTPQGIPVSADGYIAPAAPQAQQVASQLGSMGAPARLATPSVPVPPPPPPVEEGPDAGTSIIQPARPAEVVTEGDPRSRLGGGPWAQSASLVPRSGITVIDAFDISPNAHTSWQLHEMTMNKLNQVVSIHNHFRPFGGSALESSGVYIPPQEGVEKPDIPGAWKGTIANTINRDGEVQAWIRDDDPASGRRDKKQEWFPQSYDKNRSRIWGSGKAGEDVWCYVADGRSNRNKRLPRFGYDGAAKQFAFERKPTYLESESQIGKAILDSSSLTTEQTFTFPATGGELSVGAAGTWQPLDDQLTDIAGLTPTDSNFIVGDGGNYVSESGNTARTSLGVGTGDSPQFTGAGIGTTKPMNLSEGSLTAGQGTHLALLGGQGDSSAGFHARLGSGAGHGTNQAGGDVEIFSGEPTGTGLYGNIDFGGDLDRDYFMRMYDHGSSPGILANQNLEMLSGKFLNASNGRFVISYDTEANKPGTPGVGEMFAPTDKLTIHLWI